MNTTPTRQLRPRVFGRKVCLPNLGCECRSRSFSAHNWGKPGEVTSLRGGGGLASYEKNVIHLSQLPVSTTQHTLHILVVRSSMSFSMSNTLADVQGAHRCMRCEAASPCFATWRGRATVRCGRGVTVEVWGFANRDPLSSLQLASGDPLSLTNAHWFSGKQAPRIAPNPQHFEQGGQYIH